MLPQEREREPHDIRLVVPLPATTPSFHLCTGESGRESESSSSLKLEATAWPSSFFKRRTQASLSLSVPAAQNAAAHIQQQRRKKEKRNTSFSFLFLFPPPRFFYLFIFPVFSCFVLYTQQWITGIGVHRRCTLKGHSLVFLVQWKRGGRPHYLTTGNTWLTDSLSVYIFFLWDLKSDVFSQPTCYCWGLPMKLLWLHPVVILISFEPGNEKKGKTCM